MGLASCILMVDMWGWTKWTWIGRIYGANAITSYVLSGMLIAVFYQNFFWDFSMSRWFMESLIQIGFEPELSSLLTAVTYMLIVFLPALWLYKKKIFIKI